MKKYILITCTLFLAALLLPMSEYSVIFAKKVETVWLQSSPQSVRSDQEISAVIRKNLSSVKKCYQNQLETNPDLEGSIGFEITIIPEGKVSNVTILKNSTQSSALGQCVTEKIKTFKFSSAEVDSNQVIKITLPFKPE